VAQSGATGLGAIGRRWLVGFLSERTGVPQKFFQYAAARALEGVSADSGADASAQADMRVGPAALPSKRVLALIEERCPRLHAELADLSLEARTASLGQVHRALLRDGRTVAVKIRYPGIESRVRRDLSLLLSAARLGPPGRAGFDAPAYGRYLKDSLEGELDYAREASHLRMARAFAAREGFGLTIPAPHDDFSADGLLVMDWVEFREATHGARWSAERRRAFLEEVFGFLFAFAFVEGRLYPDVHPGNVGLAGDGSTCLLDFGVLESLSPDAAAALRGLLRTLLEQRASPLFPYFERMGFDPTSRAALAPRLPAVCEAALAAARGPSLALTDDFDVGARVRAVLAEESWTFRMAGPPWFFGVMRLLGYVCALSRALDAPWDLRGALLSGLDRAERSRTAPEWHAPFPEGMTRTDARIDAGLGGIARVLRVELARQGRVVVEVELPARAVFRLEDLLSDEVTSHILSTGRTVEAVKARVLAGALLPGIVLQESLPQGTLTLELK
jgi:predicted unusual protein kinase regulating ubiquinone biosynthesis (AarF/ABC1/UbiB family)